MKKLITTFIVSLCFFSITALAGDGPTAQPTTLSCQYATSDIPRSVQCTCLNISSGCQYKGYYELTPNQHDYALFLKYCNGGSEEDLQCTLDKVYKKLYCLTPTTANNDLGKRCPIGIEKDKTTSTTWKQVTERSGAIQFKIGPLEKPKDSNN